MITVDGGTGSVILGAVELVPARLNDDLETILGWADDVRRLEVHANADTPADAIEGARVRRSGDRALPHGAHVLRRGAPAGRPGDDPRGRRGGTPRRARSAPALPAERLRGHLRGDGRAAGDDPAARPAAARVPPVARGGDRRAAAGPDPGAARGEPDARDARLPARAAVAGDLRDAGARDRARRPRRARAHRRGAARRDHAPARRRSPRSCAGCASSPSASRRRRAATFRISSGR